MTASIDRDEEVWQAFSSLAALPIDDASPVAAVRRLSAEVAIRNHLYSYADAFDSKDVDRIAGHFATDGVLSAPRGRFSGQAEIRAFYEPYLTMNRFSYHRIQSITIRLDSGEETATIAAYFHAPFIGEANDARSQYGRYFGKLSRQGSSWAFTSWQISIDHTRAYPGSLTSG